MSINWHKKKQISNTTVFETKQAERGSGLSLAFNSKLKGQRLHKCYWGNVACLHKTIQQMSSTLYIRVRVSWQLAECIKDFIEKCDEIISCYLHVGATAVTLMLFQMYLFFYTTFCTLEPSSSFWPHVHLSHWGIFWESLDFLGHHLQAPRNMSMCRKSLPKGQKEIQRRQTYERQPGSLPET